MSEQFSKRMGIRQPVPLQIAAMNNALRNSVWNFLLDNLVLNHAGVVDTDTHRVLVGDFFKVPTDAVPTFPFQSRRECLREAFFPEPWHLAPF